MNLSKKITYRNFFLPFNISSRILGMYSENYYISVEKKDFFKAKNSFYFFISNATDIFYFFPRDFLFSFCREVFMI